MKIEVISIAVQIDGKPYFVVLDEDKKQILMKMAAGLSDDGKLKVVKAPAEFSFETIGDLVAAGKMGNQH